MKKQSIKTITLKRILLGATVVIITLIMILAFNFKTLTIDAMKDKGNTVAKFIQSSLVTHMEVSNREDRELYIQRIKEIPNVLNLNITRSEIISNQFNLPFDENLHKNDFIKRTFKENLPQYQMTSTASQELLKVGFPYVADKHCLSCHPKASPGETLGVVSFDIDVSSYKMQSYNYLYIVMGLIVLVLFFMLYLIFNIIDKHIKNPLDILVSAAKKSFEKHTSIDTNNFESLELEDVAKKINLFNEEVIYKNMELEEKNKQLIKLNEEIEATQKEILNTLGNISESRSKETAYHVQRVAEYSSLLAKLYGLPDYLIDLLKNASPMHDMGKIGIPDSILTKPAKLDDKEFEIMKTHSDIGYDIFKNSNREMLKAAAVIAHQHHEKWDGSGYPQGLKGEDIHIFGRITAIADVFDALGSNRVYKKAWKDEKIFTLFQEEKGKHFDPKLIDIFLKNKEKFLEIRDKFQDS